MKNDPWRKRIPRSTLVKWMLEHPDAWEWYRAQSPGHILTIFQTMQDAGLFSPRSQCNHKTITRLVEDARLAQALHSDAKALQESIRNMEAIKS